MIYQSLLLASRPILTSQPALAVTPPLASLTPATPALPLPQAGPPAEQLINGLTLLLLILIMGLCLSALVVVLTALLPQASQRSKIAIVRSPWRAFFIGLANYLFLGGISLVLFSPNSKILGLVGALIIAFLAGVTTIGLTGLAALTGDKLSVLRDQPMSPLKRLVWGAIALELASLFPLVGWFILAPALQMISFGAAVLAWWNRKPETTEEPEIGRDSFFEEESSPEDFSVGDALRRS